MKGTGWGWPYRFTAQPWAELGDWYADLAGQYPTFEHMLSIVLSVRETGAHRGLAAFTSMHDLVVRPQPASNPPYDVVAVRAPSSMLGIESGMVLIEHLSTTGHDDRVMRPVAESVPLFWQFMVQKFGIDAPDLPQAG